MKINLLFINRLILVLSLSMLSACGADGIGGTGISGPDIAVDSEGLGGAGAIFDYELPFSDQGYINFDTIVFDHQDALTVFIEEVNLQPSWEDKALFLEQLQAETIDFTENRLFIYRTTEALSTTFLSVNTPVLEDGVMIIYVDREESDMPFEEVTHYAFAYIVNKSISELIVRSDKVEEIVDLTQ